MTGSYTQMIGSYNLGKNIASLNTSLVPDILDYGSDNSGNQYITYTFFKTGEELGASYYVDNSTDETEFATNYIPAIETAAFDILNDGSYWSASFSNTIKVNFIEPENLSNPAYHDDVGTLAFGQWNATHPRWNSGSETAVTLPYEPSTQGEYADEVYGDIFFNVDHYGSSSGLEPGNNVWTDFGDIREGTGAYKVILEEVSHALGIDFISGNQLLLDDEESTQKYTVTSYSPYGYKSDTSNGNLPIDDDNSKSVKLFGEDNDGDGSQDALHAYGLQLYDIAALQLLYGRDYLARASNDTYKLGQGLGRDDSGNGVVDSNDKDNAFIYTIWDGKGKDTLDASDFDTYSAKLDLRQGGFSSIGTDGKNNALFQWSFDSNGDVDITIDGENVAIAYYAVIENAIGTGNADILIGNAWNNRLDGGAGNDVIYGDGSVSYDGEVGFIGEDLNDQVDADQDGDPTNDYEDFWRNWSDPFGDNPKYADDLSGQDHLIGGAGNDKLYGGAGNDILDGGLDNDELYGGDGKGDVADFSSLSETVTFTVDTVNQDFDFKVTSDTNGHVDNIVDVEIFKGTSGIDTIDLSTGAGDSFSTSGDGKSFELEYNDGSVNRTYEFQDFDVLKLTNSNDEIEMEGLNPIVVNGQGGTDTVSLANTNGGIYKAASLMTGDGLYVSSSSIKNTVDGATFLNIESFENVGYAHITSLGHDYKGAVTGLGNTTFGVLPNATLDYSGYTSALTFNHAGNGLGAGTVSVQGSSDTDTYSDFDTIIGTDYGDTFKITGNTFIKNLYTGSGDDLIDDSVIGDNAVYAVLPTGVANYIYTGGNDTIRDVSIDRIFLPKGVTYNDLDFNYFNSDIVQYAPGDFNAKVYDLTITVGSHGSITLDKANFNYPYGLYFEFEDGEGFRFSTATRFGNVGDVDEPGYYKTARQDQDRDYDNLTFQYVNNQKSPSELEGADAFFYESTADSDVLDGDFAFGLDGDDTITSTTDESNTYFGSNGADTINAGALDDILIGGFGNDTLNGGDGDDILQGDGGNDTVNGGNGVDTAYYNNNQSAIYADLSQTGANVDDDYDGSSQSYNDTLTNIENIRATAFDDVLIGDANDNELHGLAGDDEYHGGDGADTFYIGIGLDTIYDFDVNDGDKLSVENNFALVRDDIAIVYTDMSGTNKTLAEVYRMEDALKLADVYMPLGQRIPDGDITFNSYLVEGATGASTGNSSAYISAYGEITLDNNYRQASPQKTVVRNPWSSGATGSSQDLVGLNPTEYGDDVWEDILETWDSTPILQTPLFFGRGLYAVVEADYAVILDYTESPFAKVTVNGSTKPDSSDGSVLNHGGISVGGFTQEGSGNNDTFVFFDASKNTSTVTVDEIQEKVNAGYDQIMIVGATSSDITLSLDAGGSLYINFVGYPNYSIEVEADSLSGHGSDVTKRIESITFVDDGAVTETIDLTKDLVLEGDTTAADSMSGTLTNDTIYGFGGGDTLNGGDGNDVLYGGADNDTLRGQAGDDIMVGGVGDDDLYGEEGDDEYHWAVGDGNDSIQETIGGFDSIVLDEAISPDDVRLIRSGRDLKIYIDSEVLTVEDHFYDQGYGSNGEVYKVENIRFGNEYTIDLLSGLTFTGDSMGSTISGTFGDDTLVGALGNDDLKGGEGNDTYFWAVGHGNDEIDEDGGTDEILLDAGITENDVRFARYGQYDLDVYVGSERIRIDNQFYDYVNSTSNGYAVETLRFEDDSTINLVTDLTFTGSSSAETINGLHDDNTLIGLGGADTLKGGDGNDTYIWSIGDGNDEIRESDGTDVLQLGAGIVADDVRIIRYSTYDLDVYVGSERIRLDNQLYDTLTGSSQGKNVETLRFDDLSTIDLINNLTFKGTASGETINAMDDDNVIYGYGGADYLYGKDGNDTLYGGDGDDRLYGDDDNDILYGGDGIDLLWGDDGADTFAFESATAFNFSDNIQDFDLAEGDMLDVSDLLSGYDPMTDAITDFVQITDNGTHSYLAVDADGGADNFVQVAAIFNETGLTDEASLESSGTLITV